MSMKFHKSLFIAKMRAKVYTFKDLIDTFVGPDLETLERDLIHFLKEEFGILLYPCLSRYTDEKKQELILDQRKGEKPFDKAKAILILSYGLSF